MADATGPPFKYCTRPDPNPAPQTPQQRSVHSRDAGQVLVPGWIMDVTVPAVELIRDLRFQSLQPSNIADSNSFSGGWYAILFITAATVYHMHRLTDANFECNEEGINLQAMDNSHVALVSVLLHTTGFVPKCAKDDDICTLKALDDADTLNLIYEAKHSDRVAEYDMKLMDIDTNALGIPDTEYDARITMPSSEFSCLVRGLSSLGESVRIDVSKEGSDGPISKVKQTKPKKEADDEPSSSKKVKKEDPDVEMVEVEVEEEKAAEFDGVEEKGSGDEEEDEDEEETGRKRKKQANGTKKPTKKAKTSKSKKKKDDDGFEDGDSSESSGVVIELNSHVSLTFSLEYFTSSSWANTQLT